MNDVQEIDVDELMTHIRENLSNHPNVPTVGAPTLVSNGFAAAELSALQSSREIRYFPLTSHRKFLGSFVLLAKKVVRKLLTPSLERQSAYNTANIRLTAHLGQHAEAMQKIAQELEDQIKGLRQELIAQVREVRQELTEHAEQGFQELGEQIGGVHQEQGAALQAMRVELAEQMADMQHEQAATVQMIRGELTEQMRQTHQEQAAGLHVLRAQVAEEIEGLRQQHTLALQEMRERSSRAERRVRRFVAALTEGSNTDTPAVQRSLPPPQAIVEGNAGTYFDYFGFEERFRAGEEEVKEHHKAYIEFFKEAQQVLDIGCGRGEFLELLTEAGIKARGVDLDLDLVLYCQEKGLDVVREDAFAYLESLPDESLGGLFAAQLVEHLEPTRIIALVNLCQRKLQPGGVLLVETPNPVCLTVFARSFYMDFSHIRPIHPEAMKFLLESAGFQHLQVKFSSPVEPSMRIPPLSGITAEAQATEEFNRGIERLNDLLYGFQDYAIVGRKSAHL